MRGTGRQIVIERHRQKQQTNIQTDRSNRNPLIFSTLEFLMRHLWKVSQRGHETGMTSKNLAIVWAPNLLRSRFADALVKTGGCTNLKDIGLQVAKS